MIFICGLICGVAVGFFVGIALYDLPSYHCRYCMIEHSKGKHEDQSKWDELENS